MAASIPDSGMETGPGENRRRLLAEYRPGGADGIAADVVERASAHVGVQR